MRYWSNEREVPQEIVELLELKDLPDELRHEILKANDEVTKNGAVTYPTKGNIEYYIFNKYCNFFKNLYSGYE